MDTSGGLRQAFHGDNVAPVELEDHRDAGSDRAIIYPLFFGVGATDENRAGAAIALRTDDLCASQTTVVSKIIRKGKKGGITADFVANAIDEEEDVVPHARMPVRRIPSTY